MTSPDTASPKKRKDNAATESSKSRLAKARPPAELTPADVDAAPVVFADSLVHLGTGPFISKATFAIQGPTGSKITPNLVLTMPTNQMFEAAKHIIMAVVGSDAENGFQNNWDIFLASIRVPVTE